MEPLPSAIWSTPVPTRLRNRIYYSPDFPNGLKVTSEGKLVPLNLNLDQLDASQLDDPHEQKRLQRNDEKWLKWQAYCKRRRTLQRTATHVDLDDAYQPSDDEPSSDSEADIDSEADTDPELEPPSETDTKRETKSNVPDSNPPSPGPRRSHRLRALHTQRQIKLNQLLQKAPHDFSEEETENTDTEIEDPSDEDTEDDANTETDDPSDGDGFHTESDEPEPLTPDPALE